MAAPGRLILFVEESGPGNSMPSRMTCSVSLTVCCARLTADSRNSSLMTTGSAVRPRSSVSRGAGPINSLASLRKSLKPLEAGSYSVIGWPKEAASLSLVLKLIAASMSNSPNCSRSSAEDFPGQLGANVVERGENADLDFLAALLAELFQQLQLLGQAMQRKVAGLNGDDHVAGGTHGVKGKQPDIGGTINDAEIIIFRDASRASARRSWRPGTPWSSFSNAAS